MTSDLLDWGMKTRNHTFYSGRFELIRTMFLACIIYIVLKMWCIPNYQLIYILCGLHLSWSPSPSPSPSHQCPYTSSSPHLSTAVLSSFLSLAVGHRREGISLNLNDQHYWRIVLINSPWSGSISQNNAMCMRAPLDDRGSSPGQLEWYWLARIQVCKLSDI